MLKGILGDTGVQRQLLTLFVVAGGLLLFENYLFFSIIVPQVQSGVRAMLGTPPPLPPPLHAVLATLADRENKRIEYINRVVGMHGLLIVLVAVAAGALVWASSPRLRHEQKRGLLLDIGLTFGLLVAFQVMFCHCASTDAQTHFLGKQWWYTTDAEHRANIRQTYGLAADWTPPTEEDARRAARDYIAQYTEQLSQAAARLLPVR